MLEPQRVLAELSVMLQRHRRPDPPPRAAL